VISAVKVRHVYISNITPLQSSLSRNKAVESTAIGSGKMIQCSEVITERQHQQTL